MLTIDEWSAVWSAEWANETAVAELRRAFHTLKGSGRMVGATVVGELAWSVENMLNRVVDGTVRADQDFVKLVADARAELPALLSAFEQGMEPEARFSSLIESADLLASGSRPAQTASEPADEPVETELSELAIFLTEARQHVDVIRSRTGRRRVQFDDDIMVALHTPGWWHLRG